MMKSVLILAAALIGGTAHAMEPFVRGSQKAIVEARQGQPFVLAVWSLDCVFCRDDLALLGKLKAKHPALDVVLVATDPPERRPALEAVLAQYRLSAAASWVFADGFVERLRYEIDPLWYGELPRTYFYEADGKRTAVSGQLDEREVARWVEAALARR